MPGTTSHWDSWPSPPGRAQRERLAVVPKIMSLAHMRQPWHPCRSAVPQAGSFQSNSHVYPQFHAPSSPPVSLSLSPSTYLEVDAPARGDVVERKLEERRGELRQKRVVAVVERSVPSDVRLVVIRVHLAYA